MGIFDSLLGRGNNQSGSVQTTATLPKWLEDHLKRITNEAQFLSGEGYQRFPGQRLADFVPDQLKSFDLARGAATAHEGDLRFGRDTLRGIPQEFNQNEFDQRSNPYTQNVLQRTLDEVRRQGSITERGIQDNLINSGNFGGSRAGIRLAEHDRNQGQLMGDITADLNAANYQQAQQQFNVDRANQGQIAQQSAGLGGLAQQYGLTGAAGLGQAGALQQGQTQAGLDVAYQDFLSQRQHPYDQLGFYGNMVRGVPATTNTTQQTSTPGPSPLQQIAGLGIAGLGAYRTFF